MMIKEITLNNFLSYYRRHILRFQKGLNFVVGPCGSGKTNLARAFMFAVLGSSDVSREMLLNNRHAQECRDEGQDATCEVKVELWHKDRPHLCKSRLTLGRKERIKQSSILALDIDRTISPENRKLIYLTPYNMEIEEEHRNDSMANRTRRTLEKNLFLNIDAGIGMAILDQTMEHCSHEQKRELLAGLDELAMEQTIILTADRSEYHNFPNCSIHHIEFKISNCSSKIEAVAPNPERSEAAIISAPASATVFQRVLSTSFRSNLNAACRLLRAQVQRIEKECNMFEQRLKDTVATINDCLMKKDLARANVYTCVLAEKRLVIKLMVQARLALEKTISIMRENSQLDNVGDSLATSLEILHKVRNMIKCVLPTIETGLASIENLLLRTRVEAQESGLRVNPQSASRRAMEIMEGAAQQADAEVKERLSTRLPGGGDRSITKLGGSMTNQT